MNNSKISIRIARLNDLMEMQKMFVDTISTICKDDYSPEQIKVWTSSIEHIKRWTDKLQKQYFLIAQIENKIVGYSSLQDNDYLDFLYVHKDFQRQGIADRLYNEIEIEAIKRGSTILNSDVSITAKPFFEKKEFKLLSEQKNTINGIEIVNYKMAKDLPATDIKKAFDNIEYLQRGNTRQQQAYSTLTSHQILSKLKRFDPILVGTIPINIDIENSDLDIICCFADKQDFIETITNSFRNEKNFTIREQQSIDTFAIVANFVVDSFEIEVFGQSIPTKQQFAYRHLIIEHNLLNKHGENFRQQIIELKQRGHKTEPAFAIALELTGDPYMELLKFETNDKSPNR